MPRILPASRRRGETRRQQQLDDPRGLLLCDALGHRLAEEHQRHEEHKQRNGDQRLVAVIVARTGLERLNRQRSRRQHTERLRLT